MSGLISLSANASDNAAMYGVQFQVDGANIGAEDTTAPYTVQWSTYAVGNGGHTVTARARDKYGNVNTSSVPITVSNSGPGSGLVLALGFNEGSGASVGDSSGFNNAGTGFNTAWTATGKYGKALNFNGTTALVSVPDAPSLDLTNGMTLEAWVNPSQVSAWRTLIMKESAISPIPRNGWSVLTAYGMYANTDTSRPNVFFNGPVNGYEVRGTSQVPVNAWTHVAATFDGSNLRMYINGNLQATAAATAPIATTADALRIGGNNIWGEYFQGLIDEVRVYNRALSASEISADMSAPIP